MLFNTKSITTTDLLYGTPWGKILWTRGSVCLFQHLWRDNVCKPIIFHIVNLAMGMFCWLCSATKGGKAMNGAKQWMVQQQQSMKSTNRGAGTDQGTGSVWAEGHARYLLGEPGLPFSENETKWQETINLDSFVYLHSPRRSQMSPPEREDLRVWPDENLCVFTCT